MTDAPGAGPHSLSDVVPLYFNIFMVLQREIRGGLYPAQQPLPGEAALARRFDVSRVTIRHALSLLEAEGMIIRKRGKGTFATPPRPGAPGPGSFDGLSQNIAEFEAETRVDLLETGPARLPDWAGAEGPAQRIVRIRRDTRGPFSHSVCHITPEAAARVDLAALGNRTVIALLEAAGLRAVEVRQRLTAIAAGPEIARHLDTATGAPLIRLRRSMLDETGAAFEFLEVLYRPDRFEYSVDLTREGSPAGATRWQRKPR